MMLHYLKACWATLKNRYKEQRHWDGYLWVMDEFHEKERALLNIEGALNDIPDPARKSGAQRAVKELRDHHGTTTPRTETVHQAVERTSRRVPELQD